MTLFEPLEEGYVSALRFVRLSLSSQKDTASSYDSDRDHSKNDLSLNTRLYNSSSVSVLCDCSHIDRDACDQACTSEEPEDDAEGMR